MHIPKGQLSSIKTSTWLLRRWIMTLFKSHAEGELDLDDTPHWMTSHGTINTRASLLHWKFWKQLPRSSRRFPDRRDEGDHTTSKGWKRGCQSPYPATLWGITFAERYTWEKNSRLLLLALTWSDPKNLAAKLWVHKCTLPEQKPKKKKIQQESKPSLKTIAA